MKVFIALGIKRQHRQYSDTRVMSAESVHLISAMDLDSAGNVVGIDELVA